MAVERVQLADDVTVLVGDVRDALRQLPDASVQCCVTSPPYWGLRDYGIPGQLGLEPTPEEYVENMVGVFREVWRTLRQDGTLWLNLGDSYNGSGGAGGDYGPGGLKEGQPRYPGRKIGSLKPKDLVGIPWRVAFALQADGWFLRSDIIWAKPNPMPESVTDRPAKAHEYIFLFSKSPRYYYDAGAIREKVGEPTRRAKSFRNGGVYTHDQAFANSTATQKQTRGDSEDSTQGHNRRTVWTVATEPCSYAHFATYPTELIEPCILAGSSHMACPKCGAPWGRVVVKTGAVHRREATHAPLHNPTKVDSTGWSPATVPTNDFRSTCACEGNDGSGRCVVLDPFGGSGTTGLVAASLGREAIMCELNPDYVSIMRRRLSSVKAQRQLIL